MVSMYGEQMLSILHLAGIVFITTILWDGSPSGHTEGGGFCLCQAK